MSRMTAISLFSGAGGLDLGAEAAGFRTCVAVESDAVARSTMLANRDTHFPSMSEDRLLEDVRAVEPEALLELAEADAGDVALLVGGPPCTPFSKSGYWLEYKRAGNDARASLLDDYVRLLRGVRPRAFVMENVYGLAYRNQNRPVLNRFLEGLRAAGYAAEYRILLAADFGVPQLRQRLFCVGVRADLLDLPSGSWRMRWPAPTHSGPHETRTGWDETLQPHMSSGAALVGIGENPEELEEHVRGTYADELRAVPPGQNYLYWTAERGHPAPRFKWRSRYWSFLLKLDPRRPSPTIQGQPGPWVGPFHWESRRLRIAELKRLMTFPDDFAVLGSRRDQQLQLGNAVPPRLAETVIGAIADELARLGCDYGVALAA